MESLSSRNNIVKYLLCVIDFVTKYACVKPLKDKKSKTVLNAFIEMVNEFNCKPNNLWFDQGKKYNKHMQEKLKNNEILMHSTHNESNSVIAERFIKILKFKIYKKMTANGKSDLSYLNKLVDEYNNTYHHSINKKLINPYYSALTEDTESNPKAPKFKVNDRV